MLKKLSLSAISLSFVLLPWQVSAQSQLPAPVLDAAVERLTTMWDGYFDNNNQVVMQELTEVPDEGWEGRRLKIFKRVDLPAFGEHVTYVQQYLGEPPSAVYRQRIYHHWPNYETGKIITDIYSFRGDGAARALDAHLDPGKLEGFSPDNMDKIEAGCEVFWTVLGDIFVGEQYPELCFYIPAGVDLDEPVRLSDTITLTDSALMTTTQFRFDDGRLWVGNELGMAQISRKSRLFTCFLSVPNSDIEDGRERFLDIPVHDQGGEVTLTTTHARPLTITFKLSNLVWWADSRRKSLSLRMEEESGILPAAFAVAAPDANRIAVNVDGTEASCTIETD